jgi:uncharacterized protein YjbI with pentapeptide repeats
MNNTIHTDNIIENTTSLNKEFYENTLFSSCDFNETDLSNIDFIECVFDNCNLSLIKINNTGFKNIRFNNCKLTGVDFSLCNDFLFNIKCTNCNLKLTSFEKVKLNNAIFDNCNLSESYFTETSLKKSIFNNCDFKDAVFDYSDLTGADLSSSYNYIIDPNKNKINNATFSLNGLPGLLVAHNINII